MHKRVRLICHLIILSIIWVGCNNDVDLLYRTEPIPVVYGVISPVDSVHQIKLTKSYLGNANPSIDAQISDSLYFEDADIHLELRSGDGFVIDRVKLNETEISDKEDGYFCRRPNVIYQAPAMKLYGSTIDFGKVFYYLTISIPEYDKAVFSRVEMPRTPKLKLKLEPNAELDLFYRGRRNVLVIPNDTAYTVKFSVLVYYEEKIGYDWFQRVVDYSRVYEEVSRARLIKDTLSLTADWFYPMISGKIKVNPYVSHRRLKSISLQRQLIDPNYFDYYASLHFRSDLFENMLTNIEGGLGLFTAFNQTEVSGLTLKQQSLDSLADGAITKHLKFIKWQ